jgi:hypothetical protein
MGAEFPQSEGDYLHLSFRLMRDGSVRLLPSFFLRGPEPLARFGPETAILCELRTSEGRVLRSHRCQRTDFHSDPEGPCTEYHEVVPWAADTRMLAFFCDGVESSTIAIEPESPAFPEPPTIEREAGEDRLTLRWTSVRGAQDDDLVHMLRYSNDGGDSWQAVTAGLAKSEAVVELDTLPGGEECLFQVVTYSERLLTSTAETTPFSVEVHPRRAYLLSPEPGDEFIERDTVTLRGTGYSVDFGTPSLDDIAWTSNVDGFLGHGSELFINSLSQGVHTVRLGVADGLGGEASAAVRVTIGRLSVAES